MTIEKNVSFYGGGIYVDGSNAQGSTQVNLTIDGAQIKENRANTGAGLCVSNGKFGYSSHIVEFTSGNISANQATTIKTGKTQGGGVAVYGGTLLIKGGVVENNLADTLGPDMYISSINATDYGTVRINAGRIGSESTPSSIYVCEYAQLALSTNYAIYDQVKLEENAYIRVDGTINALNKVVIIPENYPDSKEDDIKVVEFANTLTPNVNKFDIDENVKEEYRLKVVGQDIVISEAYFNLTLNANGGDVAALETLVNDYVKVGSDLIIDVKYNTNVNDILNKVLPTRANRDHHDWDTQVDGLDEDFDLANPNYMPYNDLTLYAIWSGEHHILTINKNDSTGSTRATFAGNQDDIALSGDLAKKVFTDVGQTTNGQVALAYFAENLSRVGYTFIGFCENQNGEGTVYDETGVGFAMPATEITLYVIWQANTYTINYNGNKPATASKNIVNEVDSTICTFDSYAFISSSTFILEGWTQVNWNTKADGTGITYKLNDKIQNLLSEPNAELELFAIYKANTYTVVYNSNRPANASTQMTGAVSNTTHTYDVASPLNTAEKYSLVGYVQTSWNTQADGKGRSVGLTAEVFDLVDQGTINLYAIWRPVSYSVAYNHEGNVVSTSSFNYDTTYNLKTKESLGIEKAHHKFMGWALVPNATEIVYEDAAEILNLTDVDGQVVSLYAVWKVFSATVYGVDDQSVSIDANPDTGVVTIAKATLASSLTYLGFEIGYLNTVPTLTDAGYRFTENTITISLTNDIDLFVCWKAVTYQIVYHLNETTASGSTPASQTVWAYQAGSNNTYTEGSGTNTITLANRGNITSPSLTICGWAVKADSTTIDFDLAEQLVLTHDILVEISEKQDISSNVINLYGLWSDSYSITYNMNTTYNIIKGNVNNILGVNKVSTGSIKLRSEHTIPAADIDGNVWEIYDTTNGAFAYFLGWAETSDATTPKYVGGEVVSSYISPTTLYAVWSEFTDPDYFTYDGDKITGFSLKGNAQIISKSITTIIIPRYVSSTNDPITAIGKFASSDATGVISVIDFKFAKDITTIDDLAFENFTALNSVKNIPSKISSLGNGAFATSSLTEITFAGDKKNYIVDENSNVYYVSGSSYAIHTLLISNSITNKNIELTYNKSINGTNYVLTEVLPYAFYKTNIEKLIYTSATSLTKVGFGALKQTNALKEIKLPFIGETATENSYMGYVFGETTATGTLVPATLKTIAIVNNPDVADNAFKGFANVQKIVIGSLATIGKNAFQGCTNLSVLNADGTDTFNISTVSTIGNYAFESCTSLPTELVFSEVTTTLGAYAFANTNLEYVCIPENVITIAGTSFYGSQLHTARLYSTSAFKAVINNTNIKPTADNNGSVIYTDVNFYLVLTQVANSETYMSYTIVVDDMIAVFDSVSDNTPDLYNNIYEAISSARANSIIMIKLDIAVQTTITVNKNLTILAGYNNIPENHEAYAYFGDTIRDITLTRATGFTGNIFDIVDADVTIGSAFNKEGYESSMLYVKGTLADVVSSLIMVQQTGSLTLNEKVTLMENKAESGGAVYVAGELIVNDAQFIENTAQTKGGAIYVNDATLTVTGSVDYQFCMNMAENGGAIYIDGNSMLNITGVSFVDNYATQGGTIYFNSSNSTNASVISGTYMDANACTGNSGNSTTRGGIIYQNSGLLKLAGNSSLDRSSAYYGGIVAVYGGKFILADATISGGFAYYGGGIYVAGTTSILEISDGSASVTNNYATKGANIYFASANATVSTISAGTISYGNPAVDDGEIITEGNTGAGIFVASGKLNISGTAEISNNKALTGAGLQVVGGTVTISGNATIKNNTALESGAGIYHINSTLTINGASVTENDSQGGAGGIFTVSGTLNITGGAKITNNSAVTSAGGIHIAESANVTFATGDSNTINDISGNTAANGAGIAIVGSTTKAPTVSMSNTTILGNIATENGGGLYVGYANLTVDATTVITENVAKYGGGIYFHQGVNTIANATVSANTSTYGAIYVSANAYVTLNTVTVESNVFTNLTDGEITNGEEIKGIYVASSIENAFTISNNSKIVDTIYLTTNAIVNIADAYNSNNGHTTIKIAMAQEYEDTAIRVGKYATGINADANKFTSDADLIFVEQGQEIYIVKGVVLNTTINKKYGSLESAINSVSTTTENVIMLLEDIYVDTTLTIPANRNITIIGDVKESTQGFGLFRKEGFKDVMFIVNGTLNLNQASTTTTLTVIGLKLANTANKSMFAVNGTLNMNQNVVLTGNGTSTNNDTVTTLYNRYGGAIYVGAN